MSKDVLQKSDWQTLRDMWKDERPITEFRSFLFSVSNVTPYSEDYSIEEMHVHVPIAGSATKSCFLGTLCSIAPGFVLFEPCRREDRALLGLMEVEEHMDGLYQLKPFSPPDKYAGMSFVCTGKPSAPVYMSCIVGRGSTARTHYWHMLPDEWLNIGRLLKKYLPA